MAEELAECGPALGQQAPRDRRRAGLQHTHAGSVLRQSVLRRVELRLEGFGAFAGVNRNSLGVFGLGRDCALDGHLGGPTGQRATLPSPRESKRDLPRRSSLGSSMGYLPVKQAVHVFRRAARWRPSCLLRNETERVGAEEEAPSTDRAVRNQLGAGGEVDAVKQGHFTGGEEMRTCTSFAPASRSIRTRALGVTANDGIVDDDKALARHDGLGGLSFRRMPS